MKKAFLSAIAVLLAGAGCARYADFTLSAPAGAGANVTFLAEVLAGPVLGRGAAGDWDAVDTLNPSIVVRQGTYYNFYSGFDGKTWHTGLATSSDGLQWMRRGKVLSPEAASWEGSYIAANGTALLVGGEFLYWYQAGGREPSIGLATSIEGTRWTRQPRPVLEPGPRGSWDERGVADPCVIQQQGTFYMFYLGQDRARRQRLGVARSADGKSWRNCERTPCWKSAKRVRLTTMASASPPSGPRMAGTGCSTRVATARRIGAWAWRVRATACAGNACPRSLCSMAASRGIPK